MNYLPRRKSLYPAQDDIQQTKFNPRMNTVLVEGKYKINKKMAPNFSKKVPDHADLFVDVV
jgi:hypothetical protein